MYRRKRLKSIRNARCVTPAAAFWAGLSLLTFFPGAGIAGGVEADGLFNLTNIWEVHFRFTSDQWEAMEPKGGGGFGPRGGPFGGGRGPGGPGGFGPAMFIAPAFLSQGDLNHDGRLSK